MEPCWILIPKHDHYFEDRDDHGCINKAAHFDGHINILSGGEIVQWEFQFCEGCKECHPAEAECFDYKVITKQEALKILAINYNGRIPREILEMIQEIKDKV